MNSPSVKLSLAAGTPAMLFRLQATGDAADALANGLSNDEHVMSDGLKGRMMSDLGLEDWLVYESENSSPPEVAKRLIRIIKDPDDSQRMMESFAERLTTLQTETMRTLQDVSNPR